MRYLVLLLLPILTACGSSRNYAGAPPPAATSASVEVGDERKILYSASLDVVVSEPDTAVAATVRLAREMGGFMTSVSSTEARIRVPAAHFEAALATIATYGKVRSKYVTGQDVTAEYLDLGIRLENAERSRQRYLELLGEAQNVTETLAVERELERLNETIDRYKGQRQRLDQLDEFATINVDFERKAKLGPLGYVFKGLFTGVRWLFVRKPG